MESAAVNDKGLRLGINGFGRIGKLTLWHHIGRKYFKEISVNIGREVGTSLDDIAHYVERDSTYGLLRQYLYGHKAESVISDLNEKKGSMIIDGICVNFLRTSRNPAKIGWEDCDVKLVVDTTGQFLDPTLPADHPKGSVRGHLESGAQKVITSAPFKIKDKGKPMPDDVVTTVMGINASDYDPRKHQIVSNASCSTTCLAHMIKPILNYFGPKKILSASMATVHAATGSQQVLDRLPKEGKTYWMFFANPGKYVKQGDIIGYVGSSGLSTGPHLDFRFYKSGQAVDPLKIEAPPVEPISEENNEKFRKISSVLKMLLDSVE